MPRQVRIEYEGAFYHAMARGYRRNPIFASPDGRDEALFLETLGDCCGRTGFRIWAWVLMRNHYHLLVETPRANLVAGMGWLQNAYTRRFNSRHRQWGRLFGDRYKSVLVESGGSGGDLYLRTLLDYIHLNPVRAGLVPSAAFAGLLDYGDFRVGVVALQIAPAEVVGEDEDDIGRGKGRCGRETTPQQAQDQPR